MRLSALNEKRSGLYAGPKTAGRAICLIKPIPHGSTGKTEESGFQRSPTAAFRFTDREISPLKLEINQSSVAGRLLATSPQWPKGAKGAAKATGHSPKGQQRHPHSIPSRILIFAPHQLQTLASPLSFSFLRLNPYRFLQSINSRWLSLLRCK